MAFHKFGEWYHLFPKFEFGEWDFQWNGYWWISLTLSKIAMLHSTDVYDCFNYTSLIVSDLQLDFPFSCLLLNTLFVWLILCLFSGLFLSKFLIPTAIPLTILQLLLYKLVPGDSNFFIKELPCYSKLSTSGWDWNHWSWCLLTGTYVLMPYQDNHSSWMALDSCI